MPGVQAPIHGRAKHHGTRQTQGGMPQMQEQEGRAAIKHILRKNSQKIVKPSQQTNPDWKMAHFEGTRDRLVAAI
jgi:hypothetical protein